MKIFRIDASYGCNSFYVDFHTLCEKSTYCYRAAFPIHGSLSVLTRVFTLYTFARLRWCSENPKFCCKVMLKAVNVNLSSSIELIVAYFS